MVTAAGRRVEEEGERRPTVRYRPGVRRVPIDERVETHSDRDGGGNAKVLVRAWICTKCEYANWPCRASCRICQAKRTFRERRRDDWWIKELLPDGAELDAIADPATRQPPVLPHRRVPGLPTPGRPRALHAPVSRPAPHPPAPSVPPRREQHGHADEHDSGDDVDDGAEGAERTWATVVGAGTRRRLRKQRRAAPAVPGEDPPVPRAGHGDAARGALDARLPPPVEWDVPPVPLRWIKQMHDDVAARVDVAKEAGDGIELKRAQKERKKYGGWLKQAGRLGEASLEFGIKAVKTRLAKSERSVQRVQDEIKQREADIERIQREIVGLREQGVRHQARCDKFREKAAYLSAQLHAETIPTIREQELQECRSRMLEIGDPRFRVALDMLDTMLPPAGGAKSFDITLDDSSDTDVECPTDFDADADVGDCHGGQDGGSAGVLCEGELRLHLEEASGRLQLILRGRDQALANAKAALRRKRSSDGEEKSNDADGDEVMLPVLTTEQVDSSYGPQIAEAQSRVDHLRWLLTQATSHIPPASVGGGPPSCSPAQASSSSHHQQHQCSGPREEQLPNAVQNQDRRSSSARSASCDLAARRHGAAVPPPLAVRSVAQSLDDRTVTAEQRDAQRAARRIEQEIRNGISDLAAGADELQRVVRVNAVIMEQNQEQRELEAEIEEREAQAANRGVRQRRGAADASERDAPLLLFGPTGAPLGEQQRAMRMAGTDGANLPQAGGLAAPLPPRGRTTRWDRNDADGSRQRSKTPRTARRPSVDRIEVDEQGPGSASR